MRNPDKTGGTVLREANVTIPTEVIADQSDLKGIGNTTLIVEAAHPVVGAQCWGSFFDINNSSDWYYPWPWTSLMPDLPTLISKVSDTVELSASTYGGGENHSTAVYFSPIWVSSPESADHPLLVVFFQGRTSEIWNQSTLVQPGLLSSMVESKDPAVTASVTACSLSAYWSSGKAQMRYNEAFTLVDTGQSSTMEQSARRKITLDIAGDHPMQSAKFYSALVGILGTPQLGSLGLEGTLAAALVIWIAKVPTSVSMKKSEWLEASFFSEYPPEENIEDYTPYEFLATQYGYGYGMRLTSVYLSMTVLLLYCIVTIGYMLYTFATGSASTAWNSGAELLALALQSKRPDHLGYVGVGIDSAKTLSESVGIRVNVDNEVELVFAQDRDFNTRGLQRVKQNTEY